MFETAKNSHRTATGDWASNQGPSIDDRLRAAFDEIRDEPVPQRIRDLLRPKADRSTSSEQQGDGPAGRALHTLTSGNA